MPIEIEEVKTRKQLRQYIRLPWEIYKNDSGWLPPVRLDEWIFHNPKKNKSFTYCDTIRCLAIDNQKVVGRIMGIIHHRYNEIHQLKTARFFQLECYNNPQICHALLQFIENWARGKGMDKITGPYGFSDKDPQGLQIEGFEHPKVLVTPVNAEYLVRLVENEGYTKEIDCVSYFIEIPENIPTIYERICQRTLKTHHIKLVEPRYKIGLYRWIKPVLRLVNESYQKIYGFVPFEEYEMNDFANRYLPILDPDFIKIIVDGNQQVVGFILAIRDISKGLKKCKGFVLPFGIFSILYHQKRSRQLTLLLGAIKESYRGNGLDSLMAVKILQEAKQKGLKTIDSHLILENNHKMRMEIEKAGGQVYKRFRVYQKALI